MAEETKKTEAKELKRKKLSELFTEPCAIAIDRSLMHQAFQIPNAGTESTLSKARTKELELVYHPGYGLIGKHKGKYFLSPAPNVIVAHE